MITRKTLEQAEAERGFADLMKIDGTSDSEIEQQIAEDPDLGPPTEALPELPSRSRCAPQAWPEPA
jgi:hypothetical protein